MFLPPQIDTSLLCNRNSEWKRKFGQWWCKQKQQDYIKTIDSLSSVVKQCLLVAVKRIPIQLIYKQPLSEHTGFPCHRVYSVVLRWHAAGYATSSRSSNIEALGSLSYQIKLLRKEHFAVLMFHHPKYCGIGD